MINRRAYFPPKSIRGTKEDHYAKYDFRVVDVIGAKIALWKSVLYGILAGVALWLIPVPLILLNVIFSWITGDQTPMMYWLRYVADSALPYIVSTGVAGGVLALLRRISDTRNWYTEFGPIRMGISGAVATVVVFIYAWFNAGKLITFTPFGGLMNGLFFELL